MEAWLRLIGMRSADSRAASGSLPTRQGVTGDGPHHLVELVTTAATPEPRRPCPERGHTPPEDQGQQQTLVVNQRPSSAVPFAQDCRSSDDPGALSHRATQFKAARGVGACGGRPRPANRPPRSTGPIARHSRPSPHREGIRGGGHVGRPKGSWARASVPVTLPAPGSRWSRLRGEQWERLGG
jgi:hypothetical protein